MELRQLRYIVTVADAGGIRKAARELNMAQPSLSQALRQLEGELGLELIRRSPRGVELTDAGAEFLEYAREILDRATAARAAMRIRVEERRSILRVGLLAGMIAAGELTAPILERFSDVRPDVEVQVSDVRFSDQTAPLLSGEIDVAILRAPVVKRHIETVPLALEPRVLLVGPSHELADAGRVDVDEILGEPTVPVIAEDEVAAFWHADDYRGGSNVDPTIPPARTVTDLQLAAATHHAIIIVTSAVARLCPNSLVRPVEVSRLSPSVIEVAWVRGDRRRVVRDFVDAAVATAVARIDLLPGAALPV